MNVTVKRPTPGSPAQQTPHQQRSPHNNRLGEKGRVRERHSEDITADVLLDSGVYLKRVPVATNEWFVFGDDVEKDYNAGERDLPPVGARVFVFMPVIGSYDDSFIAPFSFFSTPDQIKPYMEDDKETIKERIMPNKWHTKMDYVTGTYQAVSPDEKSSILLDFGDKDNPLDPPELHTKLFHDTEKDDPGIAFDFVSGKTIDLAAFEEVIYSHVKKELISLEEKIDKYYTNRANVYNRIEKNEETEILLNQIINVIKHYEHTALDIDLESAKPMGIVGTETQLGSGFLLPFLKGLLKAVLRNLVWIAPIKWPRFVPVPPVPVIQNMAITGFLQDIAEVCIEAIAACVKVLK